MNWEATTSNFERINSMRKKASDPETGSTPSSPTAKAKDLITDFVANKTVQTAASLAKAQASNLRAAATSGNTSVKAIAFCAGVSMVISFT